MPGEVLFSGDGTKLVGTRILDSAIDSFTVGGDGLLTPAPGSPFSAQGFTPTQGYGQLGSAFSPTNPWQLFVSDAHVAPPSNGPAPGLVSSFADAANGVLTPIGASPFSNDGTASCWVEISHDGAYLFVVNTASRSISSYAIAAGGALTFLHSTPSVELGAGADRRPALARRLDTLGRRGRRQRSGRLLGQRREPHAAVLGSRTDRRHALGHRRHLTHTQGGGRTCARLPGKRR